MSLLVVSQIIFATRVWQLASATLECVMCWWKTGCLNYANYGFFFHGVDGRGNCLSMSLLVELQIIFVTQVWQLVSATLESQINNVTIESQMIIETLVL
jgi:hypothetical protein